MRLSREKINLIMARKQLSLTDIAMRSGKTKQRISCILNSLNVTPRTAGIIAKALDCDVTEIIED